MEWAGSSSLEVPTTRRRQALIAAAVAAVIGSGLSLSESDGFLALSAAISSLALHVPWLIVVACVLAVALAVVHYVLAGVAIRAASGQPLALGEATLSQLAASVLNRVAPGGVGAATVSTRYLSRRGMPMSAALAAVGTFGVLGGLADFAATGLLLFAGHWVGLGGGWRTLHALAAAGTKWSPARHLLFLTVAVAVLGALGFAGLWLLRRHGHAPSKETVGARHAWRQLTGLARQPRRTGTLLLSSAGTTFTLAVAFAVVVRAVVGVMAPPLAALMVVYLVGAAAASAAHIPAIAGPTEIALTSALVVSGVPAGPALVSVLLVRGLTYWAPVPLGALAVRALRRRGAL